MATKKKSPPPPKKRMGRPPRVGQPADEAVKIRLTAEERERLELAAERAGKSLAAYIRDAALSAPETA